MSVAEREIDAPAGAAIQLALTAGRAARALGSVILLLVAGNAAGLVSTFALGHGRLLGLVPLFSLNAERGLSTWFSSMQLLLGAALAAAIAWSARRRREGDVGYWIGLALIMVFLSIDEMVMIHEHLDELGERFVRPTGLLFWPWVVAYGTAAAVVAAVYLRFLRRLPARVAGLLVLSGAVFVGGAAGVEMFSAAHYERYGDQDLGYALWTTLEETLEMGGICLFVCALLTYRPFRIAAGR